MPLGEIMLRKILHELKEHLPFTGFGALSGIVLMVFFKDMDHEFAHKVFYVFHPLHVVLSALVTASLFELRRCGGEGKKCNLFVLIFIGFVGAIGVATLSDSLIPYWGETLLNLPYREAHIGFLENWKLISLCALIGIAIAYYKPTTKFPHAGHVLISTWASLFHIIMAIGAQVSWGAYFGIFAFLFLAVWLPCCVSDIIFPLLFVKSKQ